MVTWPRRAGLTRNPSGDNADVCARESVLEAVILGKISSDFLPVVKMRFPTKSEKWAHCDCGDVRQICSDTWSIDDIIERKLIDERRGFAEE